jgi:hypothetical protein
MPNRLTLIALFVILTGVKGLQCKAVCRNTILEYADTVQTTIAIDTCGLQKLDLSQPDGGLPPQPGVLNIQLFRATHDDAASADGDGWTYAHHMDLAVWKGKMYAAWNMTLKDEDRPPAKVVYATSTDGIIWSNPVDLFPRQWAWACRFYFYRASNDRMLAFCAASNSQGAISEDKKSILLVREIRANHQLGDVFTLIHPVQGVPPSYETSTDRDFVVACREAAGKNILLEQQDYGVFLGDLKMEWHDKTAPYKGFYKFGKALCFYHRADGTLVGMSKMGFVTLSEDEGKSWSKPSLPGTLTAGAAKVWGQKTNDNRYALAYNPDPKKGMRFPLVIVHGEDGIHFKGLRVVHGEYTPLRYPGLYKDLGYQYVRGLAEWSNDSTFSDKSGIWLIYSVNKEDIWVSRIPLPLVSEPAIITKEDFQKIPTGSIIKDWNIYAPRWAPVSVVPEPGHSKNRCLELRDGDPVDHAQATRLFPAIQSAEISFRLKPMQQDGYFETELSDSLGQPVFRMELNSNGTILVNTTSKDEQVSTYRDGKWLDVKIRLNNVQKICVLYLNGKEIRTAVVQSNKLNTIERLTFRTGKRYGIGEKAEMVAGIDTPSAKPFVFLVDEVKVKHLNY